MEKTTNAFKTIFEQKKPQGLDAMIMRRVAAAEASHRARRTFSGMAVSGLCGAVFVLAGFEAFQEINSSGFNQYASLIFTDGGAMVADWRDFAWTLVESVPAWSLAAVLGAGAILLAAVRWTARASRSALLGKTGYAI